MNNELLTSISDQVQFYLERRALLIEILSKEMSGEIVDGIQVIELYEERPKYIVSYNFSDYYVIELEGWPLKNNNYAITKSDSNYNDWFNLEKGEIACSNESNGIPSGFWIVSEILKDHENLNYKIVSVSIL